MRRRLVFAMGNDIKNKLFYGDNLDIMREYIADGSVDLVYLDPPFNSKRAYNQIFKDKEGKYPPSQIEAFNDTWSWGEEASIAFDELSRPPYTDEIFRMLRAFKEFLGENEMMAYLVMMAIRLWELRRVLKDTGSIYLHCDPTASHYLKIVMDQIFGLTNFRNEVTWRRTTSTGSSKAISKKFPSNSDILFFYTKSDDYSFNPIYSDYSEKYKSRFKKSDERGFYYLDNLKTYSEERLKALIKDGRIEYTSKGTPRIKNYLHEGKGVLYDNIWLDIDVLNSQASERLGYPTQKPVALLERILNASSNEGDVVLDPFCGCGTTIAAAEKLGRQWIGIDITVLATTLIKKRIEEHFPDAKFEVKGIPTDVASAREMASTRPGKFDFEKWFVLALDGQPHKSSGGGDKGIDGFMYFNDVNGKSHTVIISVKGGSYSVSMIRDLCHVVERDNASMGLLLALNNPTQGMISEAASAGRFHMPETERTYPRVQIFTVEDYFAGKRPDMPNVSATLKKAKRIKKTSEEKPKLGI